MGPYKKNVGEIMHIHAPPHANYSEAHIQIGTSVTIDKFQPMK